MSLRVLILGANGFIGSALVRAILAQAIRRTLDFHLAPRDHRLE